MQKLCPICNTSQLAIITNLSDKEIVILRKVGLPESICKPCYISQLSEMKKSLQSELTQLNEIKEAAKAAYDEACKNYSPKSTLFTYVDHNLFLMTNEVKKKKPATNKYLKAVEKPKAEKATKVEQLAKKLLASLSKEQQEAMFKTFQNN